MGIELDDTKKSDTNLSRTSVNTDDDDVTAINNYHGNSHTLPFQLLSTAVLRPLVTFIS